MGFCWCTGQQSDSKSGFYLEVTDISGHGDCIGDIADDRSNWGVDILKQFQGRIMNGGHWSSLANNCCICPILCAPALK